MLSWSRSWSWFWNLVMERVDLLISVSVGYWVRRHTAVANSEITLASFDVRKSRQLTINHRLIMSQEFIIIIIIIIGCGDCAASIDSSTLCGATDRWWSLIIRFTRTQWLLWHLPLLISLLCPRHRKTRGQSNLTKSAHSPVRGHPEGGRNLYHWISGVGVPISVP